MEQACELLFLMLHCKKEKKKTSSCQNWLPGNVLQKSFSENFAKFTERPVLESLFNNLADLQAVNSIKKSLQHRSFLDFDHFATVPFLNSMM